MAGLLLVAAVGARGFVRPAAAAAPLHIQTQATPRMAAACRCQRRVKFPAGRPETGSCFAHTAVEANNRGAEERPVAPAAIATKTALA